jgi:hypothetical protein
MQEFHVCLLPQHCNSANWEIVCTPAAKFSFHGSPAFACSPAPVHHLLLLCRHYHSVNVVGNTLRRIGNTVTCIAAPLLYQVHPALPFVLFGSLTLVWTGVLSALFAQRARECTAEDVSCIARRSPWSAANLAAAGVAGSDGLHSPAASHLAGLELYMQMSFVSQERRFWAAADGQKLQSQQQQQQQQLSPALQSHALTEVSDDDKQQTCGGSVANGDYTQGRGKLAAPSHKRA